MYAPKMGDDWSWESERSLKHVNLEVQQDVRIEELLNSQESQKAATTDLEDTDNFIRERANKR